MLNLLNLLKGGYHDGSLSRYLALIVNLALVLLYVEDGGLVFFGRLHLKWVQELTVRTGWNESFTDGMLGPLGDCDCRNHVSLTFQRQEARKSVGTSNNVPKSGRHLRLAMDLPRGNRTSPIDLIPASKPSRPYPQFFFLFFKPNVTPAAAVTVQASFWKERNLNLKV